MAQQQTGAAKQSGQQPPRSATNSSQASNQVAQRDPVRDLVSGAKARFVQFGKQHGWGEVQFAREAEFAVQLLRANPYTMGIAESNPVSLRDAIVQAAVLGMTFNPALGHAYLVPYAAPKDKEGNRKGPPRVVFQPSYRGLRDLAIEDGLIKWARSEVVYAKDEVRITEAEDGQRTVRHDFNPFAADRGAIVGAYCAWLDGNDRRDLVFETLDEIYRSHRSRSEAWKSGQKGIWATDELEAIRKALVKRAQKSWPRRTDRRAARFDDALAAEFADDSIETTATEVRKTPESARIAKPSDVPHQGKAAKLELKTTAPDEGPTATGDIEKLWAEIDDMAATLGDGDLGKASEITGNIKRALKFDEDEDLDLAQIEQLHAAMKAQVEGDQD